MEERTPSGAEGVGGLRSRCGGLGQRVHCQEARVTVRDFRRWDGGGQLLAEGRVVRQGPQTRRQQVGKGWPGVLGGPGPLVEPLPENNKKHPPSTAQKFKNIPCSELQVRDGADAPQEG